MQETIATSRIYTLVGILMYNVPNADNFHLYNNVQSDTFRLLVTEYFNTRPLCYSTHLYVPPGVGVPPPSPLPSTNSGSAYA